MDMLPKAMFFDIDGTLVPFGSHGVPAEARAAIEELRRRGVKMFVATGRHMAWIDNLDGLEFDGYVVANGSLCLLADKKTEVFKRCVNPSDLKRLVEYAPQSPLSFVVVPADGDIFLSGPCPEMEIINRDLNLPPVPVRPLQTALGKDIVQLMAFGSEADRSDLALFSQVLEDCEPTSWHPLFCDIVPRGSDKGVGVREMCRHFGIDISETVAFGDGDNDIPMLRACGQGVAMGQATAEVKAAAGIVAPTFSEGGLAVSLQRYI